MVTVVLVVYHCVVTCRPLCYYLYITVLLHVHHPVVTCTSSWHLPLQSRSSAFDERCFLLCYLYISVLLPVHYCVVICTSLFCYLYFSVVLPGCVCVCMCAADREVASIVPYPGRAKIKAVLFGPQSYPLYLSGQRDTAQVCHRD